MKIAISVAVFALLSVVCSYGVRADNHDFYKPWFHAIGYEIRSHGCPTMALDAVRYHRGPLAAGMETLTVYGHMPWIRNDGEHCHRDELIDGVSFEYHYGYPHISILFGMRPFWGAGVRLLREHGKLMMSVSLFASFIQRKWYLPFDYRVRMGVSISAAHHVSLFLSMSYWY